MTRAQFGHALLRWLAYTGTLILVLLAIVINVARWWLPQVADYKSDIEELVVSLVKQPVRIEKIDAGVSLFTPRIVLTNLHILSSGGDRTLVTLNTAWLDIDVVASVIQQRVIPSTLGVDRVHLGLARMRDGRLRVLGVGDDNSETDTRKIIDWVLGQKFLEIRHSDIVWRDYTRDEDDWYFNDVNVRLRGTGAKHEIFGSANLPLEIGYHASFAGRVEGDPTAEGNWDADFFVSANGLRAGRWLHDHDAMGFDLREGRADIQAWSAWRKGHLTRAGGELSAMAVEVGNASRTRARTFDSAVGRFAMARTDTGWRMILDQFRLTQGQDAWPATQIRAGFEQRDGKEWIFGGISVVRADHAAHVAQLSDAIPEKLRNTLMEIQPQGALADTGFYIERDGDNIDYLVQGQAKNIGIRPIAKMPGVYGLDAHYVVTPTQGRIDVDAQDTTFAYPSIFSEPFDLQRVEGSVQWRKEAEALRVWTGTVNTHNTDTALHGHVELVFPNNEKKPPSINLAARFNNNTAARVGRYLPVNTLPKDVVTWIRHALVGGGFPQGEVLYYGPLNQFPYAKGEGRFLLRTQVKDVILDYTRGWPLITGINGELAYDGSSLRLHAHEGRIYKNQLTDTSVEIPTFSGKTVWLQVRGHAEGDTAEKLRFLHESPLETAFAKNLSAFQAAGRSGLDLSLAIPLSGEANTSVKGAVQLHSNRITAAEYGLDFARADGTVFFTESSVTARQFRAYMNDHIPLSIGVDTDNTLGYRAIRIGAATTITQDDIRELLTQFMQKGHWANYLPGATPMTAGVNIPLGENNTAPLTLAVSSSLNGLAVRLPLPAAKPATGERNLDILYDLSGPLRQLKLNYGDSHTLLQFQSTASGVQLQRGNIALMSEPKLPAENALHFTGRASYLSWPEWTAVLFPTETRAALFGESSGPHLTLYFNARIDTLDAYGNRFQNVSLQASEAAQGYSLHITSDQASGNLFIPEFIATTPLVIDMEKLFWSTGEGTAASGRLDPHDLPALRISAKNFRVDNTQFGSLELVADRVEQGLRLNKLSLQNPVTHIQATGTWLGQYQRQSSRFNIELKTKDVGKMLEGFHYSGGIRGGTGQFTVSAGWLGSPFDFSLEKLDGSIKLLIDDGRLLEIDPGAARMFGLLSLQALPRRFTLDFSDMFAKGMTFDHIGAEFSVANGDAFTKNLIMDGPSALIKMAGRVGLTRRDYDQDITVVPHVGESIPLIGTALSGFTLGIGAALLVLQKLFESQIQAISTVHYKITGPWDNPTITKIGKDRARSDFAVPKAPTPAFPDAP